MALFLGRNQVVMAGQFQGREPTWKPFYAPYHLLRGAPRFQIRSFFEHCSKGGGQTHVQKFWSKFCMILKAFLQYKIDINRLFKGRNVSNWR